MVRDFKDSKLRSKRISDKYKERIKNGWVSPLRGKKRAKEVVERISSILKNQYKNGREVWSKGLTKDNIEGLKKISKKMKGNKNGIGHKVSDENKTKLSERMKGNKINLGKKYSKERRDKIGKANIISLKGRKIPLVVIKKIAKTKIEKGMQISPELLSDFENYRRDVLKETRKHKKKLFKDWNGLCYYTEKNIIKFYNKEDYNNPNFPVIDHRMSIFDGFNNNISHAIVGGIDNLCICTRKINGIKNKRSFI